MQLKIRKELRQEDIIAISDSREQSPLNLNPFQQITATLTTGDYSIKGLEAKICIERKSLSDLTTSLGQERERFDKEMRRILAYPHRCLVIEGDMKDIIDRKYRSKIHPNAVLSSLMGYAAHGIPFVFCGSREQMQDLVKRFMYLSAQRIWASSFEFINSMLHAPADLDTSP